MKFSQRKGFSPIPNMLPKDNITEELRNSIWNCLDVCIYRTSNFLWSQYDKPKMERFSRALWFEYFKKPIDTRPHDYDDILREIRKYYFNCKWYEIFDFIEFILEYRYDSPVDKDVLINVINGVLQSELSPYRIINGVFAEITDKQEVEMLEQVLSSKDYPSVTAHLNRALELLSDKKNPDFRNSIKESISAVESLAQIISGLPKATLGDALKVLEKTGKIHNALKDGFSKLYGYTSDQGGIRHAMIDEPNLSSDDAKYFLLSCTSFVNYLKTKI